MKLSEQWLREWVNPKLSTTELTHQLTMAGLEVDTVLDAAPKFEKVVIGQVQSVTQHPDAKRLRCCVVDIGEDEPLNIVCGGVNVRANIKVALAKVGAVLPGDIKIEKAALRGVTSHGMICSSKELGLGEGVLHGIMELPVDAPIGQDFWEYLQLSDHVIDIEITPNRGDCLSIKGLAREVGVLNQLEVNEPSIQPIAATITDQWPIKVSASQACPRYCGRIIQGIHPDATTPMWMQERLRRSGVRCVSSVVDICNYVMLALGQPLHAFDLGQLTGEIHVRYAKENETLTLIDSQTIQLHNNTLIIADDKGPQAIAGIMGGGASAVTPKTQAIFLESAFFTPKNISLAARCYGLHTDAGYRFERGVDYELPSIAAEYATALLLELVGGQAGPLVVVETPRELPVALDIKLRRAQIPRLIGVNIDDSQVVTILSSLGMSLKETKEGWTVKPPSYRFDISQEIDLIEEIARIYGYEKIPVQRMSCELEMLKQPETELPSGQFSNLLVDRGYHEAITYSFIEPQLQHMLDPNVTPIRVDNPIAHDMAAMRTSLWPGLIQAMRYNLNRQCESLRLFETGLCFYPEGKGYKQLNQLGFVATGQVFPKQWAQPLREIDFYDVKGDVEALLGKTARAHDFSWVRSEHPALHPGQSADLNLRGQCVGHLGALHPKIAQQMDINQVVFVFEIATSAIASAQLPEFTIISKYPAVHRDLAMVVNEALPTTQILHKIKETAGQLLGSVQVFDVYQGEGVEKGKKSVALGLTFQDPSRTLIDSEINDVIQSVVVALDREFHAKLRT